MLDVEKEIDVKNKIKRIKENAIIIRNMEMRKREQTV